MVHWPSYLYVYPSWTDILAYYIIQIESQMLHHFVTNVKVVRSYFTQIIFGPLEDRSCAYMLQDCVLPIQCTQESFRMFLAYPHTRPRLVARVSTHAMFTSSLCYASCHHDVMYHIMHLWDTCSVIQFSLSDVS
jgi:hypothetical protein